MKKDGARFADKWGIRDSLPAQQFARTVSLADGLDVSDTVAAMLPLRLLDIVAVLETDDACDWLTEGVGDRVTDAEEEVCAERKATQGGGGGGSK